MFIPHLFIFFLCHFGNVIVPLWKKSIQSDLNVRFLSLLWELGSFHFCYDFMPFAEMIVSRVDRQGHALTSRSPPHNRLSLCFSEITKNIFFTSQGWNMGFRSYQHLNIHEQKATVHSNNTKVANQNEHRPNRVQIKADAMGRILISVMWV